MTPPLPLIIACVPAIRSGGYQTEGTGLVYRPEWLADLRIGNPLQLRGLFAGLDRISPVSVDLLAEPVQDTG